MLIGLLMLLAPIAIYFAAYTGDQGGITAFYFQIAVIVVYLLFLNIFLAATWLIHKREQRKYES